MNSTSCGCRLVSWAARSPAFWITGPEVARKPTPISRATICASVVLPRPGGPWNSTWSSASPRDLAAAMKIFEVLAHLLLADEVVERLRAQRQFGRVLLGALGRRPGDPSRGRSSRQLLQAGADHRIERGALTQPLRHPRHGAERLDAA